MTIVLSALLLCIAAPGSAQDAALEREAEELRRKAAGAQRPADAIGYLEEFVKSNPGRRSETVWLGQLLVQERMFAEGVAMLEEARKRWPNDYHLAELLGTAYLELGRPEDAVAAWHSVLGDRESDVARYTQVSRLEWNAGMYDRAIETLDEARRFEKHYVQLTAAIVRMERTRGNYRGAFLEALSGHEMEDMPDIGRAKGAIASFRDAGSPPDLIAVADSFATRAAANRTFFLTLHAALLIETGDYDGASEYLLAAGSGNVPEKDLYSFLLRLFTLGGNFGDPKFEGYLGRATTIFIHRYGGSPRAPRILLEAAGHAELAARRGGPGEMAASERAIMMADSTMTHKRGRPYTEKARLIKARVYLYQLHDPSAALEVLDSAAWRNTSLIRQSQDIRLEAIVLSGRWDEAMQRFDALASSPDSTVALSGRYGRGMVLFYRGEFDEAAKALSDVAAEAPGSKWANDALETAVLIRRAETGDPSVLAAFATAMTSRGSGRFGEAADSLTGAAARHPDSPLAPEALYESALLLERAGRGAEAVDILERVAAEYPLSRAAPRAVETLASLLEDRRPDEASRWYALFLDRYGDDPWVTRVRESYLRHRKRLEEEGEKEDT
jgi:tetratricopeptide (TPR) repeat protein